jgi:hypothetical protein
VYGPPEDSPEKSEDDSAQLGSTRFFDTAEGRKSYTEVAERLAVSLAGILQRIVESTSESLAITPEWLCHQHRVLAGDLFPDWADWRFQWIHPFRDFNGRIGRVLLVALIHRMGLPPMDTIQTESDTRHQYLEALRAADNGNLQPLTILWMQRIAEAL